MRSSEEIDKQMDIADEKIQAICSKYSVTLEARKGEHGVTLVHHEIKDDTGILETPKEVFYAPF